jgi:hypothetical protein
MGQVYFGRELKWRGVQSGSTQECFVGYPWRCVHGIIPNGLIEKQSMKGGVRAAVICALP